MFENQIINSIAIVAIFLAASYAVTFLISILEKLTSKTDSDLDDRIIKAIKLPIRYLAGLLGLFYAVKGFGLAWEIKGNEYGAADALFVFIILLLGFTASRIFKSIFFWYGGTEKGGKINQTMFVFIRKVISAIIYAIGLIIILGQFNIQIGPLLAGLGVAGLAIALGLQETLANLFAALFLVLDKSINIGDWIQLEDGTKACIKDISWRSVRIRTITGNTVIVPNAVFVGQKISSYDYPVTAFFTSISVGVAYDTDLEKAEYVASQAAEKVINSEGIREKKNNPIIRYTELADSSINFLVIIKVDKVLDEGRVKHSLIKEIVKQFKENGIEIPFPQRVVEMKR
ncbi:MAG: mechanosensitive ion channel family protein [Patescibacteria group bacterium]|nr:mechanosensitive ion channel family protein [Patescibacteria group bacterium]